MSLAETSAAASARRPLLTTPARELLAAVGETRLLATVSGAARCGKSTLMDELEARYRMLGVRVQRQQAAFAPRPTSARCAVLVDDAHLLGDFDAARLTALVRDDAIDLVVAYGWEPLTPGLQRLVLELDRHRAPTLLGPVSVTDLSSYLVTVAGADEDQSTIERLHRETAGMPWLICAVAKTVDDGAVTDPRGCRPLLDRIMHELDTVSAGTRQLVLARAVGFDPSTVMSASVRPPTLSAGTAEEAARAEGMLRPDGRTIPLLDHALLASTPAHRLDALHRELVDALVAAGHPLAPIAETLTRRGVRDARLAAALVDSADALLDRDPALAASTYASAIDAGTDAAPLAARRAQAAYGAGDIATATRLADTVLRGGLDRATTAAGPIELERSVGIGASAWAQRGMLSRAADLYRELGPGSPNALRRPDIAPVASAALIGVGDPAAADRMWSGAAHDVTPTLVNAAAMLFGQGVRASVGETPGRALADLTRASDMLTDAGVVIPWPDTPAALAALVALSVGELDSAASVLDAAIAGGQGGRPARTRLLLLRAWTAMQYGRLDRARRLIDEAVPHGAAVQRRDELLLRALDVGIARRADDAAALVAAWRRARETLLHVSVDLFTLLPFGELVVAAARLRDTDHLASHLSDARALLGRLGDPPVWAVPLHWSSIQAAILAEQPRDIAPHAAALVRASARSRMAATMAGGGRAWMSVLQGDIDAAAVEAAARAFVPIGLAWEGSRLAGHAAPRAEDRRDMTRLLSCARDLHPTSAPEKDRERMPAADDTADAPSPLTVRERQIARLVLEGKTYWEIGESIFISPRTVEHHVARMRRRLGAVSRSDLLARLRAALEERRP